MQTYKLKDRPGALKGEDDARVLRINLRERKSRTLNVKRQRPCAVARSN
jgi:hypothetical protein